MKVSLDDSSLSSSTAGLWVLAMRRHSMPFTVLPGTCSFESLSEKYCNVWHRPISPNSDFQWIHHSGPTGSKFTSPSTASSGSYYMYIEASRRRRSSSLIRRCRRHGSADRACSTAADTMVFDYHGYGNDIQTLAVHTKTYGATPRAIAW